MIFEELEANNRAALLLALDRYSLQYAPFVKGSTSRLAYLENDITNLVNEISTETGADAEFVLARFTAYLKESVTQKIDPEGIPNVKNTTEVTGLDGIVKADLLDRGEIEGATAEMARTPSQRVDLNEYTKTAAPGDDLAFTGDDLREQYGDEDPDVGSMFHMWDKDIGERIRSLEDEIDTLEELGTDTNREELEHMYAELGRLHHLQQKQPPRQHDFHGGSVTCGRCGGAQVTKKASVCDTCSGELRRLAYGDMGEGQITNPYDDQQNSPDLIQPSDPNMPFKCQVCGRQGTREEILNHVRTDHPDVVEKLKNPPDQYQALPNRLEQGAPGQSFLGKQAAPGDDENTAVVPPLPTSPADRFDDYVQDLADRAAARKFSTVDDQTVHSLASQLGVDENQIRDSLTSVAIFGNYVGVNGKLGGDPSPPEGYEEVGLTNQQTGSGTQQALVPTDLVIAKVADEMNMTADLAYKQVRDRYDSDLPQKWHASVSGEQHFYLPTQLAGNQTQQQQQPYDPNVGPVAPPAPEQAGTNNQIVPQ